MKLTPVEYSVSIPTRRPNMTHLPLEISAFGTQPNCLFLSNSSSSFFCLKYSTICRAAALWLSTVGTCMLDCSLVTGLAAMARTLLLVLAAQDAARGFTLTPKPADLGARTKLPLAVNPLFKTVTVILAVLLRCASPDPLLVLSIKLRAMLAHGPPASLSSLSLSLSQRLSGSHPDLFFAGSL